MKNIIAVLFIFAFLFGPQSVHAAVKQTSAAAEETDSIIVPVSVSLVSDGHMLDFRYRVTDPEKAGGLLNHRIKPAIIVESDGSRSAVVSSPKVGTLRTTRPHQKEKTYFMLFGNPGMKVKRGDKVTVEIGDFKAEHLQVR